MTEAEESKEPADTGKKAAKPGKAPKEVSQMKAGDYTVHLLIQKAKDLEIDAEAVMNVLVEVNIIGGKQERTKVFNDVTNTTVVNFDSHIFVELMGKSVAELEGTKIQIKLQEKGYFKNEMIGQVEMDLTYIYNLENHTQQHQWMALINPDSEDFASIAAYLKFSASVYGVDDTPLELKMDEGEDDDNCVMPASIKPKYTQLKMHIIKGEELPKLDFALVGEGSMDAYISAKIGGKTIKTKKKDTSKSDVANTAIWNETFLIPVRMPIMSGKLILNVMDYDTVNDEQAGALIFDYKDLLTREQKSFFWANIYGAPGQEGLTSDGGAEADAMNKDPTIATKWKGRILIGIEHIDLGEKGPQLGVFPCDTQPPKDEDGNEQEGWQSIPDLAKQYMEPVEYHLMYEFNSCINIPEKLGKYNMQLAIGENIWVTKNGDKDRAIGYNYNRWNQRPDPDQIIKFEVPYGEVKDMDDIFLYLCPDKGGLGNIFSTKKGKKADDPISYVKLKAKDYMEPNPKLQWLEMTAEPIEDKVESPELAGVVGFRLSIVRADSGIDLKKQHNWSKKLPRRPICKKIRCYLFQCKDLPAADEDGASDPMVVVYNTVDEDSNKDRMIAQVAETQCIEDNCDPMFYQLLELKIDYMKDEPMPPFIFDVYDVDKNIIKSDDRDYMGRCCVNIDDVAKKYIYQSTTEETTQGDETQRQTGEIEYVRDTVDLKPEVPKWHSIRYAPGSPECGQILVSFVITKEDDHDYATPNDHVKMMGLEDQSAVVDFSEFRVELNVLGLRGLVSPGLLPVKKAYIDFLLKSMVPPMAASALSSVQTAPNAPGPDPTINSVISFNVPMPKDHLFAPRMSCRVYDKVFKGFSGQLIGVFTIPTGEIMFNQNKEYDENCEALDKIIKALKDVYEDQAVLDYEPVNKNQDSNLVEDKAFREQQRKEKAQVIKKVAPEEQKKSMAKKVGSSLLKKIAPPKPQKPVSQLQQRLASGKQNQLKKRLILHTDEDTDEEGETTINPVAKQDTEKNKYVPPMAATPQIDLNAINASNDGPIAAADLERLSRTPRSSLSQKEKNAVDGLAIRDALEAKHDENMLEKVTPKAGEVFKPPAPIKVSHNEIENAIKARSGGNTPVSAHSSVRQFNSARTSQENQKLLKDAHMASEAAIQRETEASRQNAEKEAAAKAGGKEIRMTRETIYENDTRLNCMREIDIPDPIIFEPLGWDREPGISTEKHYRKFFPKELETVTQVMSKPTEFQCFDLKRGQSRGAKKSIFDFGGGKQDQGTGEQDTTQIMGKFKALITVTKKDEEAQKKMYINNKLVEIRKWLGKIYTKKFKKPFPLQEGFFCENSLEGSKVMTAEQRERRYSDDIQVPTQNDFTQVSSARSKTSFEFKDRSSTILNQEGRSEFKQMVRAMKLTHLQILRKIVDVQSDEIIKRLLMSETKTNVRVYIVRAFNLAARDNDSPSDPFVKVILGEKEYSDRENYQEDEPSPDIYKMYEFEAVFPGCPLLKVQFWDADLIFGDDFIGETVVDLEDRYFSSDFKSFQFKPIEHRKLTHPSTEMSQGTVVMWAEINEQFGEEVKPYDISKKPQEHFEVRVVVWDTEDLEIMDAEGTTDGFIRCFFDSDDRKDTDTHFRNQDGKCSWNYRMLFPFSYPCKNYKLTVQAYDLDLFKSNDLIGQAVIDIEPLFEDSDLAKRPISLSRDYYDDYLKKDKKWDNLTFESDEPRQFWVNLTSKDDKGNVKINGKLKLQIDLLPKKEAVLNPVGEAQSEPNVNPYLPKPFGRIEFSLNPFKMLAQLVGPAFRRKLYCICCCIICCALMVMMAPMILSNMVSNLLTPG